MPNRDEFPTVFARLKQVLRPHVPALSVTADTPHDYVLVGKPTPTYPEGQPVGSVFVKKNYVSFHLMPVYVYPDLLDDLPARLRKRMQGKSCFNFTALDEETAADLARLTAAGVERFRQARLA